jgi:pimeloyl-ACP methyl ester carboxylesterase
LNYVRQGRGSPPLVFVHGFGCDHGDWQFQLEHFKTTHEVVACDLRGHGATPGRPHECSIEHYGGDVAALLNNLELAPAILVGHSMGCRVVLEAARLAPDRVAGLVLIDGSRVATGDPDAAEAAAQAAIDKAGYVAWAQNLFTQMFLQPSPQAAALVARALRQPVEIGAALWLRVARWDAAQLDAALAAVHAPLMAIQSTWINTERRRLPLQKGQTSPWLDLLRERIANARIEVIPGLGHFTQLEAPERVNQLIAEFAAASR